MKINHYPTFGHLQQSWNLCHWWHTAVKYPIKSNLGMGKNLTNSSHLLDGNAYQAKIHYCGISLWPYTFLRMRTSSGIVSR